MYVHDFFTIVTTTDPERAVQKNIDSLAERLDGIDDTLLKNTGELSKVPIWHFLEALDYAMKQVAVLTDTFKRVGGIPAVQNELSM